jgi:hypothetical protein
MAEGKVRGLLVMEGADLTGKTTLAQALCRRHGGLYVHHGVYDDPWTAHLQSVKRVVAEAQERLVVLDRLWLSEQVYGQAYRGGPAYDLGARCLDRVLQRFGAVTVLCVREDLSAHVADFRRGRDEGRAEYPRDVAEAARLYYDLARGNVAQGGDTYLDQLVRAGGYSKRRDVIIYDWTRWTDPSSFEALQEMVLVRLEQQFINRPVTLRDPGRANYVGSLRPRVLVVGDDLSSRAPSPWPWVWGDDLSAATWLNRALHALRADESDLGFTNVNADDQWVDEVMGWGCVERVVLLGERAAEWWARQALICSTDEWRRALRTVLEDGNVAMLPHPQWHRRFRHGDPGEYVRWLGEALA